MLFLCFLIPFISCLILFIWFRRETVFWEYFIIIFPSILITLILYFSIKNAGIYDTEYFGHYVAKACYYEAWDEYIYQTCTREVPCGTDEDGNTIYCEETYDCSYVDYHYPRWTMVNNVGDETEITESDYQAIKSKFKVKSVFIDMHRNYYRKDGDKYECRFDGNRDRMWTLTESHQYKNKILRSKSIFNFSEVSEQDKEDYRLFNYKEFGYLTDQNPIMAEISIPKNVVDSFKYLNAYYGDKYQFRCYVMIWKNAPIQTSVLQEDYFVGGNKNELCICISVDDSTNIQWLKSFSWEDNPNIVVGVNHLFANGEHLNLMKLNRYLIDNVPRKWKRKEFKDFDYINTMLSGQAWLIIVLITLIYNIFMMFVAVKNEEHN